MQYDVYKNGKLVASCPSQDAAAAANRLLYMGESPFDFIDAFLLPPPLPLEPDLSPIVPRFWWER